MFIVKATQKHVKAEHIKGAAAVHTVTTARAVTLSPKGAAAVHTVTTARAVTLSPKG